MIGRSALSKTFEYVLGRQNAGGAERQADSVGLQSGNCAGGHATRRNACDAASGGGDLNARPHRISEGPNGVFR